MLYHRASAVIYTSIVVALSIGALSSCGRSLTTISFPPIITKDFAVLKTRSTPDDKLPNAVYHFLADSTRPTFAPRDLKAARRVTANQPNWLLPSVNQELCLVTEVYPLLTSADNIPLRPTTAVNCTSEAEALNGRLVITQPLTTSLTAAPSSRITGAIPDGAANVSVVFQHAPPIMIQVQRNAYEAVATDPMGIRFSIREDGHMRLHTVPLAIFSAANRSPAPSSATNSLDAG